MPQLDLLTYCSQYIALVISFLAVYAFAVQRVIPNLVATEKLRQKLNSIALLSAKLNRSSDDLDAMANNQDLYDISQRFDALVDSRNYVTYEVLSTQNLGQYAKPKKPWLASSRMVQQCQTLMQKKLCLLSLTAIYLHG